MFIAMLFYLSAKGVIISSQKNCPDQDVKDNHIYISSTTSLKTHQRKSLFSENIKVKVQSKTLMQEHEYNSNFDMKR